MHKYEARVYVGKEIYNDLLSLVTCGMFESVNQALGEIIKTPEFKTYLSETAKAVRKVKEEFENGK